MTTLITVRETMNAGINRETRVDAANGIVYGVKLLGRESVNRRRYSDTAIHEACKAAESSASYIDHPAGESNARSVRERFGRFVSPYIASDGVLCAKEYRFNPHHGFGRDFIWLLENARDQIGFSINADAEGSVMSDGTAVVERFRKIHSFDLVDRPATTNGILTAVRESVQHRRIGERMTDAEIRASSRALFTDEPATPLHIRESAVALFAPPRPTFQAAKEAARMFGSPEPTIDVAKVAARVFAPSDPFNPRRT